MREPTELEKKQYERMKELLDMSHQRYLNAGGEPRRTHSGLPGKDFLTEPEREEAVRLMRILAGTRLIGDEVHCQGRTWKVSSSSPAPPQDDAIRESSGE